MVISFRRPFSSYVCLFLSIPPSLSFFRQGYGIRSADQNHGYKDPCSSCMIDCGVFPGQVRNTRRKHLEPALHFHGFPLVKVTGNSMNFGGRVARQTTKTRAYVRMGFRFTRQEGGSALMQSADRKQGPSFGAWLNRIGMAPAARLQIKCRNGQSRVQQTCKDWKALTE